MLNNSRLIPESPRWLLFKGKTEKAERVLRHIAEVNRKPLPHDFDFSKIDMVCIDIILKLCFTTTIYAILDVCHNPDIKRLFIC